MSNEYLSVSEIAQKAGVSRQTAYNRAKGEWRQFTKEVDGKLYISVEALTETAKRSDVKANAENLTPSNNSIDSLTAAWGEIARELRETISAQKNEIENLREDLRREREENGKLREKLLEYSERFADVAERAQELTRNAQTLHALSEAHEDEGRVESRGSKKRLLWWRRNAESNE